MTLLSSLRGRTSDNEAKAQEFIVWFSTAADVEEQGLTVAADKYFTSVWVRLLFLCHRYSNGKRERIGIQISSKKNLKITHEEGLSVIRTAERKMGPNPTSCKEEGAGRPQVLHTLGSAQHL